MRGIRRLSRQIEANSQLTNVDWLFDSNKLLCSIFFGTDHIPACLSALSCFMLSLNKSKDFPPNFISQFCLSSSADRRIFDRFTLCPTLSLSPPHPLFFNQKETLAHGKTCISCTCGNLSRFMLKTYTVFRERQVFFCLHGCSRNYGRGEDGVTVGVEQSIEEKGKRE